MAARDKGELPAALKLVLASSNPGKRREYLELAGERGVEIVLLPNFSELPAFDESFSTFAENAAGKALHYSRFTNETVLADDSGLIVPVLGGAPGVHSARYAGPKANDQDRYNKLLREMNGREGQNRRARFVCVTTVARQGRVLIVTSDSAEGLLLKEPRGAGGFGYDPIFLLSEPGCTFAEATGEQKNRLSHRGKAFRKSLALLADPRSFEMV
ncbi:MAG: RdgB/HAM1 family non-canonical purine NTP pyrophosphatase [Candidatus Acidiferrales bacterium]